MIEVPCPQLRTVGPREGSLHQELNLKGRKLQCRVGLEELNSEGQRTWKGDHKSDLLACLCDRGGLHLGPPKQLPFLKPS